MSCYHSRHPLLTFLVTLMLPLLATDTGEGSEPSGPPIQKLNTPPQKTEETRSGPSRKRKGLCVTCHQRPRSVVFLPCGHQITCPSCADDMESCATCRRTILGSCEVDITDFK